MSRDISLSHSFMGLSFAVAALLILSQTRGNSNSAVATIATPRATPPAAPSAPIAPPDPASSSVIATSAQSSASAKLSHPGIALALQTALNPSHLAEQSGLVIDLSDRLVYLYKNWRVQASYPIAVGREGWETPIGKFSVINMQIDPVWRQPFTQELVQPGANNPLGSRWIGIWSDGEHQIGLHGTNEEDLIGQAVSHGCIRMREPDVQGLYDQVSVGMPVEVRP